MVTMAVKFIVLSFLHHKHFPSKDTVTIDYCCLYLDFPVSQIIPFWLYLRFIQQKHQNALWLE
jgi:hypothetical protein